MARTFEQILRPRRQVVKCNAIAAKIDQKVLELQAAMEILSEVFDTNISEIELMLKQHYEADMKVPQSSYRLARHQGSFLKHLCSETGEWPQEFCLVE
jgi:hypothetical protein